MLVKDFNNLDLIFLVLLSEIAQPNNITPQCSSFLTKQHTVAKWEEIPKSLNPLLPLYSVDQRL